MTVKERTKKDHQRPSGPQEAQEASCTVLHSA